MSDLLQKALTAKRESKFIEFKQAFDTTKPGEWCEIVKDLVAIANTGGGIIVFGLNNDGTPVNTLLDSLFKIDPADIANKIVKYTGPTDLDFEIIFPEKDGFKLLAILVQPVSIPIVFQKPGTYDIGNGKQTSAFSVGTVYFRHGAKSEPGTTEDIRRIIERQLEGIRKSWLKGVRKVVQAPQGSRIITVSPSSTQNTSNYLNPETKIRIVDDSTAIPVKLTRDSTMASSGIFVHEEISDGIFDEINNIIDANRVLSKNKNQFAFGQSIYYRVYAERQHVHPSEKNLTLLFHAGLSEFYAPLLYWCLELSPGVIADNLSELYFYPRSPHINNLLRIAILLGQDFYTWLFAKWENKWKHHPQPPSFYWTFKEMISKAKKNDPSIIAARCSTTTLIPIDKTLSIEANKLLEQPEKAAFALSNTCVKIFGGDASLRGIARTLDFLAYGAELNKRANEIGQCLSKIIGNKAAGDVVEMSA